MMYDVARADVLTALRKPGVTLRSELPESESVDALIYALLRTRCAQAYSVGIRPSYSEWCIMQSLEQSAWQDAAIEAARAALATQAAAAGNAAMARRALHDGDEAALRQDAMLQALELERIKEASHG